MTAEKGDVATAAFTLRPHGWNHAADLLESQATRIATLSEAMAKAADDMEKWFGDAIRPDEWKLREWINSLRRALSAGQGEA